MNDKLNSCFFLNLKQDKKLLLNKLQEWALVPKEGEYMCPTCGGPFTLTKSSTCCDGYYWYCNNYVSVRKQKRKRCDTQVSLRKNTFFDRSKLSIIQILMFVYNWVHSLPLVHAAREIRVSKQTTSNWASFCREVVLDAFLNGADSPRLGGTGKTVEIDESKFGRRKYHRGRHVEGAWVFGAFERVSGRVFMTVVSDRSAAVLGDLIQKWILPGTTIISDFLKTYDGLDEIYNHLKVNHAITFRDKETGAHTNSKRGTWRAVKDCVPYGRNQETNLPGNLARYMFIKSCKAIGIPVEIGFFQLAGSLYNPLHPNPLPESEEMDVYSEDEAE